ncbi:LuxR family transcriptional regulator [Streptomyces sp. NPDC097619]|uniref:LuxR family transcriptional regulator n=1 Tax=Streptomyces sp. NPDC097619 TaxID=3157228 RepID=UPI003320C293
MKASEAAERAHHSRTPDDVAHHTGADPLGGPVPAARVEGVASDAPAARPSRNWAELVDTASAVLAARGRLAVYGPWGAGKTTLLDALADGAFGVRCLRIHTQEGDQDLPYGSLAQLPAPSGRYDPSARCDPSGRCDASGRNAPPLPPGAERLRRRAEFLARLAAGPPVLLLVDGAQWIDPAGADVLGHAARVLPPERFRLVVAERTAGHPARADRLLGGHPARLLVPPAGPEETGAALARAGLPGRWAAPVHRYTGGHRALLDACCRALAGTTAPGTPAPPAPPARVRETEELATAWLADLPAESRMTLRTAALAHRPDPDLLRRAGHQDAEDHLARALRHGLLDPSAVPDHGPRFAARVLAHAARATGPADDRRRAHARLAAADHDPLRAARHRALARTGTDPALAEDTERAAHSARAAGDRRLAAELLLLAARLTPADHPAPRLERLAGAARDAAAAGSDRLARQAADLLTEGRGSPAQQVHAHLAVADARGQDLVGADPLFAAARTCAGGDPALLAAVDLRTAVQANLAGDTTRALRHATAAAEAARTAGDPALRAAALTMTARAQRLLGHLTAAPTTLDAALALGVPPTRIGIRNSPQYLAARHAVFDGRLTEARLLLLDLLTAARASGDAEDLVDLYRSLAETDAGLGACARALHWAERALDLTEAAGLSPGPAWYTAALAHLHGGSFAEAGRYAARGLRVSREEHDVLHTTRNLWLLGAAHLYRGRAAEAAPLLAEVADREARTGAADPAVLRWQADAVEAFAATGDTRGAHALLERVHGTVGPHPAHAPLRAALTRARAVTLHADGRPEEAVELLRDAARTFGALGRPVEEGRAHLARGRVERRRRRTAAARTAWETARTVFDTAEAHPWTALATEHLAHVCGRPADSAPTAPGVLTAHELRLAVLVRAGATNQEAARRLYVSAKTVETALSRIYRKLGVRNRAQLSAALPADATDPVAEPGEG